MMRLLIVLFLAPACRTLQHEDLPPREVELLPNWSSQAAPGNVSNTPWWESFDDESLSLVIEEALVANPSLRESAARIEAAAAEARIAGADLKPVIGISGNASRTQNVFVGLPVPGGNVLTNMFTSYGVSLDVSWEADLWGRIASLEASTEHEAIASAADFRAAQQSLAAQTAKAWFAWQAARIGVEISERAEQSFSNALEMTGRRLDGGRSSAFEYRLAETDLASSRALTASQREIEARALRQLELLLGRHPDGSYAAKPGLPKQPETPTAGLPGELIARRPDLIAAEQRLLAADERLYSARASLYPRLTLSGSAGRISDSTSDLIDPDFSVWSLAAGLTQPVFQGGRLRAGVDLADARVKGALAGFETALLQAVGEVELALVSEKNLELLQHERDIARDLALETNQLAADRYSAGRLDVLDLLSAERRALENERASIEVQLRRLQTRVDLHLALGGGFGTTENPE